MVAHLFRTWIDCIVLAQYLGGETQANTLEIARDNAGFSSVEYAHAVESQVCHAAVAYKLAPNSAVGYRLIIPRSTTNAMLEIVADKLIVDGVEVATIAATQRKTVNFQGEEANLETVIMINGVGTVINTPIEPVKATPAPKTKPEKADA